MRFSPAVIIPLLSTALFMLGNGYLNTFISLRMSELGHTDLAIGIIASAYYVGLVVGALQIAKFIVKMGHLRVFVCIIGLFNCVCFIHAISDNIYLWFILRLLAGISLAGFYITIESWLLEYSTNKNRGIMLALYMVSISSAQAFGQLFLDIYDASSAFPFIIVISLLSLSIIPIAISSRNVKTICDIELIHFSDIAKLNSGSVAACLVSGLILSSVYSLLPLVFERVTGQPEKTAYLMFITLLGGTILQYPIGLLSDNFDRRKVLVLVAFLSSMLSLGIIIIGYNALSVMQLTIVYFIFGGMSFTFYPVALSIVCDRLKRDNIVSASQNLSLIDGLGSILGPIIAPQFMNFFGLEGLTIYFIVVYSCFFLFLIFRTVRRRAIH